jgi:hypothetical protein
MEYYLRFSGSSPSTGAAATSSDIFDNKVFIKFLNYLAIQILLF